MTQLFDIQFLWVYPTHGHHVWGGHKGRAPPAGHCIMTVSRLTHCQCDVITFQEIRWSCACIYIHACSQCRRAYLYRQLTLFSKVEDGRGELIVEVQFSEIFIRVPVLYLENVVEVSPDWWGECIVCFPWLVGVDVQHWWYWHHGTIVYVIIKLFLSKRQHIYRISASQDNNILCIEDE